MPVHTRQAERDTVITVSSLAVAQTAPLPDLWMTMWWFLLAKYGTALSIWVFFCANKASHRLKSYAWTSSLVKASLDAAHCWAINLLPFTSATMTFGECLSIGRCPLLFSLLWQYTICLHAELSSYRFSNTSLYPLLFLYICAMIWSFILPLSWYTLEV